MKLSTILILIALFMTLSVAAPAAETTGRQGDGSSTTNRTERRSSDQEKRAGQGDETLGAVPELTQAEQQMKLEEEFQRRLINLRQVILSLDKRMREMRRETTQPPLDEIDQINRQISLSDDELRRLAPMDTSTLAQIQWQEQQDKLFQVRVGMEVMSQRWDSGRNVFGIDFFKNAPPIPASDQRPAPQSYKLRSGDKVRVVVLSSLGAQDEHLLTVDNTGSILVPGAGRVSAAGKTTGQLENLLEEKVSARFKQLRVQVTVAAMSTIQVQVSGDVERPGTYILRGTATVIDALVQAGGPTKSGTFRRVELSRDSEPKRAIDLYDFLLRGNKKQDLPLADGDLIFVPSVGPTVTVGGEVVRPGRYEPTFPTNLGAMLKVAGQTKPSGYIQAVQVERVEDNQYKVLLSEPMTGGDGKSGFQISPGDQITVISVRPDRTNQVSIAGPVKAPGLYGFQDGLHMADLLKMAQGFAVDKEVYGGRADVLRIDPMKGTEIISVNLDKALMGDAASNIQLSKLDRVFLYEPEQVVFRPKLVTVNGALVRPGVYKRAGHMRVSDAVAAAGGVLPQAYLERADLVRLGDGEKTTLLRIDLQSALNGDPAANIELRDRDQLNIYSSEEVTWRDRKVRIEGAVQRPGTFVRSEGMRVSDLLFASGGLLPEASGTAELARCAEAGCSTIRKINLAELVGSADNDPVLEDRDVVTVTAVNPRLRAPEVVYLTGEVVNPGPYVLTSQDEKLSDVIARAGGLTGLADTNGLIFLRRKSSVEKPQQELDSDLILTKARIFADKQFLTQLAKSGVTLPANYMQSGSKSADELSKPSEVVEEPESDRYSQAKAGKSGKYRGSGKNAETQDAESNGHDESTKFSTMGDGETVGGTDHESSETAEEILRKMEREQRRRQRISAMGAPVPQDELKDSPYSMLNLGGADKDKEHEMGLLAKNSARISVNLGTALKEPGSPDNLALRDGDRILVPKLVNVVTVIGAVLHPHAFAAGPGKNVNYYIERSGGYAQEASRGDVVVVRTNGDALPQNRVKSVLPGDIIVVPTTGLIDIAKKWERVGGVTKVISDVLSSVFVLTRF
ncbi:MAG: SLBB domain-containing protein [Armatimonadetes bacterium]|nr:SLBB domain-containing protein [Armatimonadota bacterium]